MQKTQQLGLEKDK